VNLDVVKKHLAGVRVVEPTFERVSISMPSAGRSITNRLSPSLRLSASLRLFVRVTIIIASARSAPEAHIFCPLMANSSPSRLACVSITSVFVPASGSVTAM